MHLIDFCHWSFRRNKSIFHVMFLYGIMRGYGEINSGGCCYSNINYTLMIIFFTSICIERRGILCSSFMTVLLMFVILWRLIILYLLLSTIILGGTGCFPRTSIVFWFIFTRAVWFTLYTHTQKIATIILFEEFNAWKTFDLTYYWPACGKNVSTDWWVFKIRCRIFSKKLDFVILDRRYFTGLVTLVVRIGFIIICDFCWWCSWISLNLIQIILLKRGEST